MTAGAPLRFSKMHGAGNDFVVIDLRGGATPPPPAAASADLPLLSELPDNIRRQIPAMAINGVVYSDNPGQRVLLVNQQVLTQGRQAVPDVKLEEIRPHSSVFSFQGTRFRLAH